jgi:hypothetical protein
MPEGLEDRMTDDVKAWPTPHPSIIEKLQHAATAEPRMADLLNEAASVIEALSEARAHLREHSRLLNQESQRRIAAEQLVDRAMKIFLLAVPDDQMVHSADFHPIKAWVADAQRALNNGAALICQKCGADRYAEGCRIANPFECPMVATAATQERK